MDPRALPLPRHVAARRIRQLAPRPRFSIQFPIGPCQLAGNPGIRNREPCTPAPPPSEPVVSYWSACTHNPYAASVNDCAMPGCLAPLPVDPPRPACCSWEISQLARAIPTPRQFQIEPCQGAWHRCSPHPPRPGCCSWYIPQLARAISTPSSGLSGSAWGLAGTRPQASGTWPGPRFRSPLLLYPTAVTMCLRSVQRWCRARQWALAVGKPGNTLPSGSVVARCSR
jgi:hypothetical protein